MSDNKWDQKRNGATTILIAVAIAAFVQDRLPRIPPSPALALSEVLRGHALPVALPCVPGLRWDGETPLLSPSADVLDIASRATRLADQSPSEESRCVEVSALVAAGKIHAAISRARDLIDDFPEPGASTLASIAGALSLSDRAIDRVDALDIAERARTVPGGELPGAFNSRRAFESMTGARGSSGASRKGRAEPLWQSGQDPDDLDAPAIRFLLFERRIPEHARQPGPRLVADIATLAEALSHRTGDLFPRALALEIATAESPPAALVAAERARVALDDQRPEDALELLKGWPDRLKDPQMPPSRFLLNLQKGRALHYLSRNDVASSALALLEKQARERGFLGLAGRAAAILGAQASFAGRLDDAIAAYSRAEPLLEIAGESAAACHVSAIHAGLFRDMGLEAAAWALHERSFRLMTRYAHPRHEYMAFAMAAETAFVEGRRHASARFNLESLAIARVWGDPTAIAEETAHLLQARAHSPTHQAALAAESLAFRPESTAMRTALLSDQAILEAEALRSRSPGRALDLLDAAEPALVARGDNLRRASLLVARSAILERLGRSSASDAAAWAALDSLSTAMHAPLDLRKRLAVRDRWHDAIRQLVGNAWNRGDPRLALAVLDGARASATDAPGPPLPGAAELLARIDEQAREMPPGSLFVSFLTLRDATILLRLDHTGIHGIALPVGRLKLQGLAHRLRRRVLRGQDFEAEAAALYEILIRPLGSLPVGTLYLSTDGSLAGLPWAVLLDARSRRYLLQQCGVALSPSLGPLTRPTDPAGPPRSGSLIVSSSDPSTALGFDGLPGADLEAREIAAIHEGAVRISNREATLPALLTKLQGVRMLHFSGHAIQTESGDINLLLGEGLVDQERLVGALQDVPIVIVSGCGTASGRTSETTGSSGIAGLLGRSNTGARVATLGNVDDVYQTELMTALHRTLRKGQSLGQAYRASCLGSLDRGRPASAWAIPVFLSTPRAELLSSSRGQ